MIEGREGKDRLVEPQLALECIPHKVLLLREVRILSSVSNKSLNHHIFILYHHYVRSCATYCRYHDNNIDMTPVLKGFIVKEGRL